MNLKLKDNFSSQASTYARFRPAYPPELYEFLLSLVEDRAIAWDCGCGNGQVAAVLAEYFDKVEASDISEKQLEHAIQKPNIHYQRAPAEKTKLTDGSVNLVTVAQAIHWFDFDAFYREIYRVSKPSAIIAIWCYSLLTINKFVDEIIMNLYRDTLGDQYWDAERHYIDEHYQTIPFPFEEIPAPEFSIRISWTFDHLIGYLNTWSAVQHYIRKNGENPVTQISSRLKEAWGEHKELEIEFPLFSRIGRIKPFI